MISGKNFQITTVVLFVFVAFLLIGCSSKSGKVKETQEQTQEHAQEQTQGQNRASNAVSLEDLLNNKEKFNGQKVVVTGRVTKVNKMIMDRNWIHIADDANRDFTITTNDEVEIGNNASFEGVIATDKDFGAGYKYDIIMEDARLLK